MEASGQLNDLAALLPGSNPGTKNGPHGQAVWFWRRENLFLLLRFPGPSIPLLVDTPTARTQLRCLLIDN